MTSLIMRHFVHYGANPGLMSKQKWLRLCRSTTFPEGAINILIALKFVRIYEFKCKPIYRVK